MLNSKTVARTSGPSMFFNTSTALVPLIAALLFFLIDPASSQQQTKVTPVEFIDGMISISASKCMRRGELAKEYERQGKILEADGARNGEIMICDCMPSRLRHLRATLSPQERSLKITEAEFSDRYVPRILAPCTGESLRRSYAEGCSERFSRVKLNSANYCSCMGREVAKFTDLETMELGRQSADYMPIAAEAKKQGRGAPDQPPLLRRMTEIDAACSRE